MSKKGKYLVLEGIDGAGKTEQTKKLAERLGSSILTIVIREPGSTPAGTLLRELLINNDYELQPESQLDVIFTDRRETMHQIIRPAVKRGDNVIGDRNWFSTVAYQGYGKDMNVPSIIERAKSVMEEHFIPDGAIILDLPTGIARSRLDNNAAKADRFEKEGSEFFEKTREGYLWLAKTYNIPVVDASRSFEEVHEDIYKILSKIL